MIWRVVRSMYTDIPAHEVATVFMNTGSTRLGAAPASGRGCCMDWGLRIRICLGYVSLRPGGTPPRRQFELAIVFSARCLPGV